MIGDITLEVKQQIRCILAQIRYKLVWRQIRQLYTDLFMSKLTSVYIKNHNFIQNTVLFILNKKLCLKPFLTTYYQQNIYTTLYAYFNHYRIYTE